MRKHRQKAHIRKQIQGYTHKQCNPVDSPVLMIEVNASTADLSNFSTQAKILKGHLLSTFMTELQTHSTCPFHCMEWLLNDKPTCNNHSQCIQRFTLLDDLNASVYASNLHVSQKKYYQDQFKQVQEKLDLYIAHLVRGKYQRMQFMHEIDRLETGKAVVVCDYMMKLLLEKFREPQRDWFGKKGVSVHGSMFFSSPKSHQKYKWKYTTFSLMEIALKIGSFSQCN